MRKRGLLLMLPVLALVLAALTCGASTGYVAVETEPNNDLAARAHLPLVLVNHPSVPPDIAVRTGLLCPGALPTWLTVYGEIENNTYRQLWHASVLFKTYNEHGDQLDQIEGWIFDVGPPRDKQCFERILFDPARPAETVRADIELVSHSFTSLDHYLTVDVLRSEWTLAGYVIEGEVWHAEPETVWGAEVFVTGYSEDGTVIACEELKPEDTSLSPYEKSPFSGILRSACPSQVIVSHSVVGIGY